MVDCQKERELWELIEKFSKAEEVRHTVSGKVSLTEYFVDFDVLSVEKFGSAILISLNDCEIYGYIDVKSALENPPDEN